MGHGNVLRHDGSGFNCFSLFDGFVNSLSRHFDHRFDAGDSFQTGNGRENGHCFSDEFSFNHRFNLLWCLRSLTDAVQRILNELRIGEDGSR